MRKHTNTALIAAALAAVTALSAGISAHAEETPVQTNDEQTVISCVGSVSKTYVSAAIMHLADQGKVELDAPVTDYLPEFRMADARYKDITVRMLLNHRSGIMGTTAGDFMQFDDRSMEPHDTMLRELQTQRLKADPDDFGAYCNDGFELAELIVEEVSGMSYTDYVETYISKPLGLKHTGTPWDLFRSEEHVSTYMGNVRFAPDYCMDIGSGGIMASAADVCTFGSAFFKGDTRLLSEKAKQEMAKTSVTDPYEDGFGLGWDVVDYADYQKAGVKVISKGGDVMEQHAGLIVAPEQKISVAVLSSGGSSMTDEMMGLALMDIALEEQGIHVEHPKAAEKETLDTVPEQYLAYEGLYLSGETVCQVSFPEQKYMQITTLTSEKRVTEWYLYTTEDSFVKMDGNYNSGKAVQAKAQSILHFIKRNGTDYIVSDSYYEMGEKSRMFMAGYSMQRLDANPVSAEAQAAWDARSGKKYYFYNGRYSNAYYAEMPSRTVYTAPEAPGYAGTARIVDADHLEAALVMPGGRDLMDVAVQQVNGAELLVVTNNAVSFISEDAIPLLDSSLTEVALHTKQASWYQIGESESQTITLDIPEHAAVYVYDSHDRMTYSSYMLDYGDSVPLPAGGKIVFLGEDGGVIRITQ